MNLKIYIYIYNYIYIYTVMHKQVVMSELLHSERSTSCDNIHDIL